MDGAAAERSDQTPPEVLAARLAALGDSATSRAIGSIALHLAALVDELHVSPGDLRGAVDFLTAVGHSANDRRQEWVLLFDVLGLSTLVDDRASPSHPGATPHTLTGPFYRAHAPDEPDGASIARDGKGEPLAVTGRVLALGGRPVKGALIEVWQASAEGLYENQQPDRQPDFNLRGRFRSDAAGRFAFRSIRPCGYALPEDGPVGRLFNSLGYRLERPAHLHFRLTAQGFRTLTTHVFDQNDPAIGRDALFAVKPDLLADFRCTTSVSSAPEWALDTTFTLVPGGPDDSED